MLKTLAAAAFVAALALPSLAAPEPESDSRRTPWGLYVTAVEAHRMKAEKGDGVLLVDVRDPIEIMFTGFGASVDLNIPAMRADPAKWHPKKPSFAMEPNAEFEASLLAAMQARGLGPDTPVLLMCRSGSRSAAAAKRLEGSGLTQVYNVIDGFEGSSQQDPDNPARNFEGWKNSGLPWSYKLDRAKMTTVAE